MQTRTVMTIAVLNGNEAGKVLRATRTRLSVGSSADNDLVLRDPDIAPFHFTVIIDGDGWRAEPVSSSAQIVVDRRWSHPNSGRKGAMVYAAGTELLVFPGELEDPVIQRELRARKTGEHLVSVVERELTRRVSITPPGGAIRRSVAPMPLPEEDSSSPTLTLGHGKKPIDPLLLSSMPTHANAQIEDVLAGKRPEPQVVPEPPRRNSVSAWDRASRGRSSVVPEVLAEPESQMVRLPKAAVIEPELEEPVTDSGAKNAWGEARNDTPVTGRGSGDRRPPTVPPPPRGGTQKPSSPPRAGTGTNGGAWRERPRASRPPLPDTPVARALVPYAGPELSLAALEERSLGEPALSVLRDPDGELATAIRLFVTRLLDLERTHGYRAYMLTSAEPLTGKTTVAINLAFALAEDSKRRIALIEADFRNPRMGEILDLPPELGLLGVLEGRLSVPQASIRVANRNLVLFPSGGTHASPAEVLASPRFKTVIQELAQNVDVAIIDAPPVKPTADANLLLPLVDGAMLVVLNEETRGGWIEQALDQLGIERVLGAIYNNLDRQALKDLAPQRKERLAALRTRG